MPVLIEEIGYSTPTTDQSNLESITPSKIVVQESQDINNQEKQNEPKKETKSLGPK